MAEELPLQETSREIWDSKYRLKDKDGNPVDNTVADTYRRVALALEAEEDHRFLDDFTWALENGATPAGRIMANAGAKRHKPATSTINCTVSGTIEDSMDGILKMVYESGNTLKAGCGIGYEFSTIRPKGAYVHGAGAYTCGPLSFMNIYDTMCFTVASSGGRRGAQMATFDISHPDILEFIKAKREDGRLRQFNLSLLITDEFMEAVKHNRDWLLYFPIKLGTSTEGLDVIWKDIPNDGFVTDVVGNVACKVYARIPAKEVWDTIMKSTYDYAEPGFILIDKVNEYNNNWFCENIRATNPCGEQPLPPYGSCLLGSINLTKFIVDPFGNNPTFNMVKFANVVKTFTRMLDNVIGFNGLPLDKQEEELLRKRRHGMGYFGLGSALAMLKVPYGSAESVIFTEEITKTLAIEGWRAGVALAKEKGCAPIFEEMYTVTPKILKGLNDRIPTTGADASTMMNVVVGDSISAKVLFTNSKYMRKIFEAAPELEAEILEHGCRFTHHSSIAPTGTIALSLGNNASNGIEPSFSHSYYRNVLKEGKKSKEQMEVMSYEYMLYKEIVDAEASIDDLPDYFVSSDDITPKQHVDVQAAAQKWIDSSISKTINVPSDMDFREFEDVYQYAYDSGLKGCTTFRFNPEAFQGVLVKDKDLADTQYTFTLDDGKEITVPGNEQIDYDGEVHTAANLFDALKEGYYGKL